MASLAALHERERSGRGQFVDISQVEALITHAAEGLFDYVMNGTQPPRRGNRDSLMCPHNVYPTQCDDTWVTIACGDELEWRALTRAIGRLDLAADPRFQTAAARKLHEEEIDREIAAWTVTRDRYVITDVLQGAGVAAFPVMTGRDLPMTRTLPLGDSSGNSREPTGAPGVILDFHGR